MPSPHTDRNLLFGILALQMDFVRRDQLIAAMNAWVLDKDRPLGLILQDQGALGSEEHALLEALVQKHLQKHDNDPARSLAALSSVGSVCRELEQVADADVQASLAGAGLHHTAPATPGAAPPVSTMASASSNGDRFRILRPHARGGLGEVFVASDVELHREVALKEIQQRYADHPESRARFLLEAEVTGRLEHPGIVPVYGLGQYADGRPFYAMRFIRGDSLKDAIARFHQAEGPGRDAGARALALRELLGRFLDVCNALAYAHSRGVLHRDLKPGNIMLGKYGETLVVDWGLAKVLGQAETASLPEESLLQPSAQSGSAETLPGAAIGTPQYMSPEQARGELDRLGPASDVYSLGATLYHLLTGVAPVQGEHAGEVLAKVQRGAIVRPRQVKPEVAPALEAICLKALALEPADRYATPRALADDLEHWLADEPVSAYREPWPVRFARWRRRHRTLVTAAAVLLLTLVGGGVLGVLVVGREQARGQALARVEALREASAGAVPVLLEEVARADAPARSRLRELWEQADLPERQQLRVGLALLPVEPDLVRERLRELLLAAADPQEVILVRDALRPHAAAVAAALWQEAQAPATPAERRFRALAALAALDPEGSGWTQAATQAAEQLLTANPLHLGTWKAALEPVRAVLVPPLSQAYRAGRGSDRGRLAATLLADYAADRPEVLIDLLVDGDAGQYAALRPAVGAQRDRAVALLRQELGRTPTPPPWPDAPLDPAWSAPDPALVRQIEAAHGLVAERFALCQTLPLADVAALAEGLGRSGYRPIRVRPHGAAPVQAAVLWTRDGRGWQLAQDLDADALRARDAACRGQDYLPVEVAGYGTDEAGGPRFLAVWVRREAATDDARIYLDVPAAEQNAVHEPLRKEGFVPATLQVAPGADGQPRYSGVWRKGEGSWDLVSASEQPAYEDRLASSELQVDVAAAGAPPPLPPALRDGAQLAEAEKALQAQPNDLSARFRRAQALYRLGRHEEARADLDLLIARSPRVYASYRYRALVHARLGQAEKAQADLAEYRARRAEPAAQALLEASVAVYLGDDVAGLERLEKSLEQHAGEPLFAYNAACAYALAAAAVAESRPQAAATYADRAVALLRAAVAGGYRNLSLLRTDTDLDAVRRHAGYVRLLAECGADRLYAAVWHGTATREVQGVQGLDPAAHRARCQALAAQGYRPAALAAAPRPGGSVVTASVWHRPLVDEAVKDQQAKRQAQTAVALLHLGQAEAVWPLLRHTPEPRVRSYLLERLGVLGADVGLLLARLEAEPDVSARRGLLLALGEFGPGDLPAPVRAALVPRLLAWYRDDPDPGIHGAIDWLLRHGREGAVSRPLDWGQAEALARLDQELAGKGPADGRRWYVNSQGQTLVCIPGPVEFLMGSPGSEAGRREDEVLHQVRIQRSFALASKPVTGAQWRRFLQANPTVRHAHTKSFSPDEDGPIISVTWYEAAQYCRWLSEVEGVPEEQMCYPPMAVIEKSKDGVTPLRLPANYLARTGYRLPTEAEWEYGCRAGAVTARYYGGAEELLGRDAWFSRNSGTRAWPVGEKRPNDLGLFDVQGNVWQWCQGGFRAYVRGRSEDGEDTTDITDRQIRALRGGAFDNDPVIVRAALRNGNRPSDRNLTVGLRVARTYPW